MSGMKYGLQARCVELAAEVADLQQTFDLQWEADMRAVELWREAHPGNELVLPDRANMVVWLLEQHDARAQCDEPLRKATEMRNAIDMIEGALMGLGDFVDLPDLFEGTAEHVHLAPKMTVGEMRRVCTALAECTRIINSDEFAPDALRRRGPD